MISLYLHIPFCQSKCNYCSFVSFPIWENSSFLDTYISSLKKEIRFYAEVLKDKEVKTLYFWGWTPNLLWADMLISLIEEVSNNFDLTNLWELSFEFNPYPEWEIYDIINKLQKRFWKEFPRIRFSFWIQSFDNEVLQLAWRKTLFIWLVDFLRWLQPLKQDNTVFNFDFIAFWKWNKSKKGNRYLWSPVALEFFNDFVNSLFADSFSLYTLELIGNQKWKSKANDKLITWEYFWTDDEIYEEFSLLKDILLNAGYSRYEISNFALAGKSSIHNRVYWNMENYLWLWLNSASYLNWSVLNSELSSYLWIKNIETWVRFKNVSTLKEYCLWEFLDGKETQSLSNQDYLIESFFLSLRTDKGINDIKKYESILVDNYKDKLKLYKEEGYVFFDWESLVLSDEWMDVSNTILSELMKEI